MNRLLNIPNMLTLSRIVLLPGFIGGFYLNSAKGLFVSFCVFILCCVTDYLDGYLARAFHQTTEFGKMLDPLADKILICISVLYMAGFDMISKVTLVPTALTICRELLITGLREHSQVSGKNFQTSFMSKCKTATQMIAIIIIFGAFIVNSSALRVTGEMFFWISAALALFSGISYFKKQIQN